MGTVPLIRVVAAVIAVRGRYLITQRRPTAALPLLWEFPGGRVEPGESDEEALRREIRHRVDVEVDVGNNIGEQLHHYQSYSVDFRLYDCRITDGVPRARAVNDFKWVRSREFEEFTFTPVDEASMTQLLGLNEASD